MEKTIRKAVQDCANLEISYRFFVINEDERLIDSDVHHNTVDYSICQEFITDDDLPIKWEAMCKIKARRGISGFLEIRSEYWGTGVHYPDAWSKTLFYPLYLIQGEEWIYHGEEEGLLVFKSAQEFLSMSKKAEEDRQTCGLENDDSEEDD